MAAKKPQIANWQQQFQITLKSKKTVRYKNKTQWKV